MVNAALTQFVQSGYEKASTNEIVKEAQISKGSLFNYFNNKKDLYLYLIDHALKIIDGIYDEIDLNERDLFKRLSQVGLIKLKIQQTYPLVFDFLKSIGEEQAAEVKPDIEQLMGNILDNGLNRIYENIDWSKFREDVDPEKALHILNWTMVGFAEAQIKKIKSFKNVGMEHINEWNSYSKILKRCFYKEGEE
ncbi:MULTISPECIES: TetR/AcrR family transcriptional regulator [unclassified Bacillus (in: firmicutes)]|uniref:TetR/AcrR family transcriptional regulator n=1 Tax=unclassified Bacillus (in: firmicutes) TaxID=185979 RepID=UPI0022A80A90|nr:MULTISPECIES: TetR/AcrR family transcriptional regulator [unclassified Bacillus (in: firmicutes)]WFA07352.1 TetR/AcrR family transcriptional regulator [Bacillus sp. HSf4]